MKKSIKKQEEKPVNVYNVNEMRSLGLRSDEFVRDPNVWTKSKKEKKAIRKITATYKNKHSYEDWHIPSKYEPYLPYKCKLIVYLNKNKVFTNSVHSIICTPNRIIDYLNKFKDGNESLVKKYSYNGKMYQPNERPSFGI